MPSKTSDPLLAILAEPVRRGSECKVCLLLSSTTPERRAAISAALADPSVGINTVRRALVAGGIKTIGNYILTKHREENHGSA